MPIDLAAADAAYKRFPSFAEWAGVDLDLARWREHEAALEELRGADPEARRKALEVVRRAAAVQTGAIEGLYRADRGFTFTVAAQSALMEQALGRRTDKERALIEDQLAAYEHVLDFATQSVPIAEAWIRQLHAELCRRQKTYEVHTPQGIQEHLLPLGTYKEHPNHVVEADGSRHSYAPVSETPREMARLVVELATAEFATAHPILQAAYAHYVLVWVHPFADGNGRVARALGSVYTCRAYSLPILIFEDARARYFDALKPADRGRPAPFVDFVLDRCIDSVRIVGDSFRVARKRSIDEVSEGIADLYRVVAAHEDENVDRASGNLKSSIVQTCSGFMDALAARNIELLVLVPCGNNS